jgi:putative DNA primase/helicase
VLATGHRAAAIAASTGRNATDEIYKQLAASVLAGDQMILLDNLDTVLDLPLLCQILTEQKVTIRRFGKLENVIAACVALVGATGNNLAIAGDIIRRFVVARIIIDEERPELREFDFDPVEEAKKHRSDLVVAALTVVRAYLISGERQKLPRWARSSDGRAGCGKRLSGLARSTRLRQWRGSGRSTRQS